MAKLLLDISRLATRSPDRPPSGIDRMEYSYLCYFLNQPRQRVGFFTFRGKKFRRLTWEEAQEKRDEIAKDWVERQDQEITRRVRKFSPLMASFLRGERVTAETEVLPRRLPKRGVPSSILLSVSHGAIDKTDLWATLKQRLNAKLAAYVHDLIPYHYPEFAREGEDRRHVGRLETMISVADLVLTNSHFTSREFKSYCGQLQVPTPPVKVLPLGVAQIFRDSPPLANEEDVPWFIYVGTIEPRKNHNMLLMLWQRLHARLGDKTPKLLLVGRRGWEIESTERLLDRSPILKQCVVELPNLSDIQLAELLRRSTALLFPSFVEGFGLPIAEALAVGVPVICSDIPAFREVGGDVPEFIDPLDGPKWLETILDYSSMQSVSRTAQLERIQHYQPPTWERHFALLESGLRRHCSLDAIDTHRPQGAASNVETTSPEYGN